MPQHTVACWGGMYDVVGEGQEGGGGPGRAGVDKGREQSTCNQAYNTKIHVYI